jgi:hypothetical protein
MAESVKENPVTHTESAGRAVPAPASSAETLKEKLAKRMKIQVTKK